MAPPVRRGDVFLVSLDPTVGREIRKARPCVALSPDELNRSLRTVTVAPITTGGHPYPFRVTCRFQRKSGFVVLDQLRAVDVQSLVRRLGRLSQPAISASLAILQEMFAE
ncbi:MAG: type II toxin-antitoxin system PemK/MazF family toxin [Gemmatimonadetes bacterium]|nr:type II toxin-antitoxin system PemK/MazF family toxin [Gemmatimonadota bacterium]